MALPPQMSMPRDQVLEYRQLLHAEFNSPAVTALRKLAELRLEMVKSQLLRAQPDELRDLQGQARVWQEILKYIDSNPVAVDKPVKTNV